MRARPLSRIRCVRPVARVFLTCPRRFPVVECPLVRRAVVATFVYAAISRCNRVASVRAIDGVVVDMYVNGWRLKGVSYSGGS